MQPYFQSELANGLHGLRQGAVQRGLTTAEHHAIEQAWRSASLSSSLGHDHMPESRRDCRSGLWQ